MQGGYVVLAAEPVCICGIDVAAPSEARSAKTQTPAELFRALDKQFTAEEVTPFGCALHAYSCRQKSAYSKGTASAETLE